MLFKAMNTQRGAQSQEDKKDSPGGSEDPRPEQLDCEMEVPAPGGQTPCSLHPGMASGNPRERGGQGVQSLRGLLLISSLGSTLSSLQPERGLSHPQDN